VLERDYGAGLERAIAGLSMGGLGAMGYAARNPGLFRAAASFSGLLHPLQDADFLLGLFSAFTPNPRAIWGDPATERAIWARHDPTALADRLRGVPLFVSAGNGRPGPLDTVTSAPAASLDLKAGPYWISTGPTPALRRSYKGPGARPRRARSDIAVALPIAGVPAGTPSADCRNAPWLLHKAAARPRWCADALSEDRGKMPA